VRHLIQLLRKIHTIEMEVANGRVTATEKGSRRSPIPALDSFLSLRKKSRCSSQEARSRARPQPTTYPTGAAVRDMQYWRVDNILAEAARKLGVRWPL
jgi:hypothetical protein